MAHDHHHHGESLRDYFAEQLLTIFVAGSFGLVGILMYRSGQLKHILAEQFHTPVLIGGIAVLVLVVVRAISVWREAGQTHGHHHEHDHAHGHEHDHGHGHAHGHHDHDHVHGPDCDHDHDHAHVHHHHHEVDPGTDDHGHSHDLAWVFARMLVLFFPVALFLIGVPNAGFSKEQIEKLVGWDREISTDLADVARKEGTVMSFNDLNDAANDDGKREYMEGQAAFLEGRFRRLGDQQFTLFRLKMTCCAADTVPLKVRIVLKSGTLSGFNDFDWVQVKGQIQFVQAPNSTRYIPVIKVEDVRDIRKTEPKNEYE